jgi:hypothetical protein
MPKANRIPPAFKHGAYARTTVLPGEDPAAFEKLRQDLIAELAPNGALEKDIVATIARLVWRKQNLGTLRIAELAQERCRRIQYAVRDAINGTIDPYAELQAQIEKGNHAAEDQVRKELGYTYEFVEIGEVATFDGLTQDLAIEEQLFAMIDKCLKRLLLVKGLKSISGTSSSAPTPRIAGPRKSRDQQAA